MKAAGLPDIKGLVSSAYFNTMSGAFYKDTQRAPELVESGQISTGRQCFAASKSNSIYGTSSTVQPPSITLVPQIRF